MANFDSSVIEGFGDEWSRFDQSALDDRELSQMFENYFGIFPWSQLPDNAVGFDLGCGSGRWAKLVAPRVGTLHLIDPSSALDVAKRNLSDAENCVFHKAAVDNIPLANESCDFGYSLGVLHHIPDTGAGLASCVAKLKHGAPFLLYLYYRFDNRPWWFRSIWKASEVLRFIISRSPHSVRYLLSQAASIGIYFPLAKLAKILETRGYDVSNLPLAHYRNNSFYTMRTDALDRFGTRLEKRFTRTEIDEMMREAGLENVIFGSAPYWTAVGFKK